MKLQPTLWKEPSINNLQLETPLVCIVEITTNNGRFVSKMLGVAYCEFDLVKYHGIFKNRYGYWVNCGQLRKVRLVKEPYGMPALVETNGQPTC